MGHFPHPYPFPRSTSSGQTPDISFPENEAFPYLPLPKAHTLFRPAWVLPQLSVNGIETKVLK